MSIPEKLIAMVKEASGDENVTLDTPFDALDVDSLDFVELIQQAEEQFNVTIPDDDAARLLSVGELARYIENRLVPTA